MKGVVTTMMRPTKQSVVLALLAGALLLGVGTLLASASSGSLAVTPGSISAVTGMTVDLAFTLSGAANTQGADIQFGFDPAVLQAVDADAVAGGVQVSPGSCPEPDIVVINDVDNSAGTGQYAAVSLGATCSDGPVFTATFTCAAEGASQVVITSAEISDPNGDLISVDLFSGTVNCNSNAVFIPLIMKMP